MEVYDSNGLVKVQADHGGLFGLEDDDHSQYALITTGSGAPASTPTRVGAVYIDLVTGAGYIAEGTASAADWRLMTHAGFLPYAIPIGATINLAFNSTTTLAANGGSAAMPIYLSAPIRLQSVIVRNMDTNTARDWGWHLYRQNESGDNTLEQVAAFTGSGSFTPSAASDRELDAGSAPVVLGPGMYWLVIQNRHATSTFGLGGHNAATSFTGGVNMAQTKTLSVPPGATLDFTAATWTKVAIIHGALLRGRVFGESTGF